MRCALVSVSSLLQELCMKQPLHRKKLQLALQALGDDAEDDLRGKLDHNWVTSEYDKNSLTMHTH